MLLLRRMPYREDIVIAQLYRDMLWTVACAQVLA